MIEHALFDDLVRPQQQRLRDCQAERLRGLQVYDQLELCWLLDGKIGGPGTLESPVYKMGGAAERASGHTTS